MNDRSEQILKLIKKRAGMNPETDSAIEDFLQGKSDEYKAGYREGHTDGWFEGMDGGIEKGRTALHHALNLFDDKRIP